MESNNIKKSKIRIAIVGCLHGHIKDLYDDIKFQDEKEGKKTDLVLCCGDFQSIRNKEDLNYISCPDKYKNMGQFHLYYSGNFEVPYLTIFIGGNHEASNVLEENYYGGWILEKVFYLGKSGVVNFKGITIAGLSGIFKVNDYFKGHFEEDLIKSIKSVYHAREFEIAKLANLEKNIDIFMSHDWPTSVVNPNDFNRILKIKSFWADELKSNSLGSPVSYFLLKELKPYYWFSGHMHFNYENQIVFADKNETEDKRETNFIALDKPVQRRKYFTIVEYTPKTLEKINDKNIYFNNEWLAILKTFNEYFPTSFSNYDFSEFIENVNFIYLKNLKKTGYLNMLNQYNLTSFNNMNRNKVIPNNFLMKLEENRNLFKDEIEWENKKEKSQRDYILSILEMEDFHKTKRKNQVNYKKIPIAQNEKNMNNDHLQFNFDNIYNKTEIPSVMNKNSEELDVDIDFI